MEEMNKYLHKEGKDLWFTEIDRDNLKIDYRIKEVLYSDKSPYQHIMVLDSYDFGKMLVLDGAVQTTSLDGYIYNEMISHVPLSIHPDAKNVLIIGGGDCGVAKEVSKYDDVEKIDMVEIDKNVVMVSKKYIPEVSGKHLDQRINFIFTDGVAFAKNQPDKQYDIVIVDSPDPVGPAVELYGENFYKDVYRILSDDGMMVCQSESPILYEDILTNTYQKINNIFPIARLYTAVVPTYPGGLWGFTLGSKKYLEPKVEVFDKDTSYVNKEILSSCFDLPEFLKQKLRQE